MKMKKAHAFLASLAANNSKEWMDANKKEYLSCKRDFEEFVKEILFGLEAFDPGIANEDPKKCIFRINRDVRFSANKDPYKTNFGAYMAIGGRTTGQPGYYIQIQPGNNFLGGGLYHPEAESLKRIRQEIDYNGDEFLEIVSNVNFKKTSPSAYDDRLKTVPKGYAKDHPNIDWLKYKSYAFMHGFSDEETHAADFPQRVVEIFKHLHPLILFLRRGLDG